MCMGWVVKWITVTDMNYYNLHTMHKLVKMHCPCCVSLNSSYYMYYA